MDVRQVAVWRVREPENPLRARITEEGVGELAESISEHGLLNPITVRARGDFFEVVAGHRRLLAVRRLKWDTVRVQVVEAAGDLAAVVGAHENLIRRDMSIGDEARLVGALVAVDGEGIGTVARKLNRSEGWVRDRLGVLQWPGPIVGAVDDGKLSLGAVQALMGVTDERERSRLLEYALAAGCSVAVARRWRDLANLEGEQGGVFDPAGVTTASVTGALSSRTGCFVCGEVAMYAELIYCWTHRECAVLWASAITEARKAEAGAPPGGGVGVFGPDGSAAPAVE